MTYNYNQTAIHEVAELIKSEGFRVFIAKSGRYGFFTDTEGTRVISFQADLGRVTVSGNYQTSNPKSCGTGWQISDSFNDKSIKAYFNESAPRWAVTSATWRYTTLAEHLIMYQASSKYVEQIKEHQLASHL